MTRFHLFLDNIKSVPVYLLKLNGHLDHVIHSFIRSYVFGWSWSMSSNFDHFQSLYSRNHFVFKETVCSWLVCDAQVLSNGSLYVNKVFMEDAGKYGCMAGNNGGLEREEAYLHVHSGRPITILCQMLVPKYISLML